MNLPKLFRQFAATVLALFVGFIVMPTGRAQSSPQINDSRYLFIFDTSTDMKRWLPAVQAEMNQLMSTGLGGQLRLDNSLGVWTFDQNLRAGQFPLQHWNPDDAAKITSAINTFISKQHYANKTRFDALQPQLNQVIHDSGRLTVLIFCDGEDEIKWTPYDAGINQVFQQRFAEQKKMRQPFVLVLRTQLGQYVGCTANFPPGMVSLPEFPPPSALVKTPPPAPPPVPVIKPPIGPPLIIIGTKVETNRPPAPSPSPATNSAAVVPANVIPAAPTNPIAPPLPAIPVPTIQTNTTSVPSTGSSTPANPAPLTPTNLVPVQASKPMASKNVVAPPPENSGSDHKSVLAIGVALLIAAVALGALAVFRSRRADRNSLITRSMRKD